MKNNDNLRPPFKVEKTLIIAGNQAQLFLHKEPLYIHYGKTPPPRTGKNEKSPSSISRTRTNLYRLVNCNLENNKKIKPTFCTLTYKKNQTNRKQATSDLRLYHQRLSYYTNTSLRYIAIPEFQKRGAIHYHIIYFNLPFIPVEVLAKKIWGHGQVDIHLLSQIKNTSAYVSKYITKETLDKRHKGHRLLITSRGLKRPITIYNKDIDYIFQKNYTSLISRIETDKQIILTYDFHNTI